MKNQNKNLVYVRRGVLLRRGFWGLFRSVMLIALSGFFLSGCGGEFDVNVSQSTGGSIVSADGFIDCGTECTKKYKKGTEVSLSATANPDYVFMNWTGDCSGVDATCSHSVSKVATIGATFSPIDEPDIGSSFDTVAGSTIQFSYTGSTDFWDNVGLFVPSDNNNESPVSNVRIGVGTGVSSFRVPTDIPAEGIAYQLRMYNSDNETIVIDDNIFISDYDASFSLSTVATSPEGVIEIEYSGSTDFWDSVATFRVGAPNSEPLTNVRIGSNSEGVADLIVPWEEGEFEVRMINNNGETIVAGPNITLNYGAASVLANSIVLPGASFDASFSGATDFWDKVALYAQESSDYIASTRTGAGQGSVSVKAPSVTGVYDLRLVNNHQYTIQSGGYVAVLEADVPGVFSAPEIAVPGQTVVIAYSGAESGGNNSNWVGLFEQGASNNSPLSQTNIDSGQVGYAELVAPTLTGIYDLRLINGNNVTLAEGIHVSVVDAQEQAVYIQNESVAGETLRFVYSGSTDFWDYMAIYAVGETDSSKWIDRVRVGSSSNGPNTFRVPTISGDYEIRLIDSDNNIIAEGHEFTVVGYDATLSLNKNQARPQEEITVTYSGLTDFWDKIAFFVPGTDNSDAVESKRLGDSFEGSVSVQVPSEEGLYEVRLLNNDDELILNGGTIELSYGAVGVSTVANSVPGETLFISYQGSTDFWDKVSLVGQDQDVAAVSAITNGVESGVIEISAPVVTGVYNLTFTNSDGVLIAEGEAVSVLDSTEVAVFVGHATAVPNESLTIGYSGSEGFAGSLDKVGIFLQGTDNSAPLDSFELAVGSTGSVMLSAPAEDGIYEVRLYSSAGVTLAVSKSYLRVIDVSENSAHVPLIVGAGETHKVIYSGSTDFWDYIAIYNATESNPSNYLQRVRVSAESGYMEIRLPTVSGDYFARLIDTDDGVIATSNVFAVEPYDTVVNMTSIATPGAAVEVAYTGTSNFWDKLAVYEAGQSGLDYLAHVRIPETGTVSLLTLPTDVGVYDVRAVNDKGEVMAEVGTITLTYDVITISGPELIESNDPIPITYDGSTQFWDAAVLLEDLIVTKPQASSFRIGSFGAATVELPGLVPGVYGLEMVNSGNVLMADGGVVAVIDPAEVALYAYPRLGLPGQQVTLAYSGSNTASNTVGIYQEGTDNLSPLVVVNADASEGSVALSAPLDSGVYDMRFVNLTGDTLADGGKLYVLDGSVVGVYGQAVVKAGETLPIIHSGSSGFWDKVAYYPVGAATTEGNAIFSLRVGEGAGAVDLRVPTIEGEYELRLTGEDGVIAVSSIITVLPYDGDVDPS